MLTALLTGFLIGGSHAFETDHIAAVSALVAGKGKRGEIIVHGALWGLGHTLTLMAVGGMLIATQSVMPERAALGLETAVGLMLIGLGLHLFWRLRRERVHFHRHRHSGGPVHLHMHSHAGEPGPHDPDNHAHAHPDRSALRTLAVGTMHGLAGSAAVVLGLAASMGSLAAGLAYIAIFGLGSILGMAAISALLSVPLLLTARRLGMAHRAVQTGIGLVTTGLGAWIVLTTAPLLRL